MILLIRHKTHTKIHTTHCYSRPHTLAYSWIHQASYNKTTPHHTLHAHSTNTTILHTCLSVYYHTQISSEITKQSPCLFQASACTPLLASVVESISSTLSLTNLQARKETHNNLGLTILQAEQTTAVVAPASTSGAAPAVGLERVHTEDLTCTRRQQTHGHQSCSDTHTRYTATYRSKSHSTGPPSTCCQSQSSLHKRSTA